MKKIGVLCLMIVLIIFTASCKILGGEDDYYITLTGADFAYSPFKGGSTPLMQSINVQYKTSTDEIVKIKVDWTNGTFSSADVVIQSSQEANGNSDFQCELWCPEAFYFSGTKTITIKVTMERQGKTSQTISIPFSFESW